MKMIIMIITTLVFLLSVNLIAQNNQQYNPCRDKKYLELKEKDLDSMSTREFEYFILKEKECSEYRRTNVNIQKLKPSSVKISNPFLQGMKYGRNYKTEAELGGLFCGLSGGLIGWGIGYIILMNTEIEVPTKYLKKYMME